MRSDARANRERILDAAGQLFDENGIDTPVASIIREIGIGAGTFYRHFPQTDDLYVGVYDRIAAKGVEVAQACARAEDSWERVTSFIDTFSDLLREHPSLPALMRRIRTLRPDHDPAYGMREPMRQIARSAIKDGHVRSDLKGTDITMIPFLLASWERAFPPALRRQNYERARALLLDGITRKDGRDLPGRAVSADEFRDAVHGVDDPQVNVI